MGDLELTPAFDPMHVNNNQQYTFTAEYPTVTGASTNIATPAYKFTLTAQAYDTEKPLTMTWGHEGAQSVTIQNGIEVTCSALETADYITFVVVVNLDGTSFDSMYTIMVTKD